MNVISHSLRVGGINIRLFFAVSLQFFFVNFTKFCACHLSNFIFKEREKVEKEKKEREKYERDVLKKAIKNERKQLRNLCKDKNYFTEDQDVKVQNLTDLDRLCEILSFDELKNLNIELKGKNDDEASVIFTKAVQELNDRLEQESLESASKATKGSSVGEKTSTLKKWSPDELALLIKAVNLFPAGTTNRYVLNTQVQKTNRFLKFL